MAFMMPVVKNDWDIYKSNRTRRNSETSNTSSSTNPSRSRKVSECSKSNGGPSLSTSPDYNHSPAHRHLARCNTTAANMSSRNSASCLQSPSKYGTVGGMHSSKSSPSMWNHDRNSSGPAAATKHESTQNKFHIRLVDKLRKSLTKDSKSSDGNSRSSS